MVGIETRLVTSSAKAAGTHSSTMAKGAGFFKRTAVVEERSADSSVLPCTLKPPKAFTDCGVRPQMPHHGDACGHDGAYLRADFAPAFELHGVRAAFLQKAGRALRTASSTLTS